MRDRPREGSFRRRRRHRRERTGFDPAVRDAGYVPSAFIFVTAVFFPLRPQKRTPKGCIYIKNVAGWRATYEGQRKGGERANERAGLERGRGLRTGAAIRYRREESGGERRSSRQRVYIPVYTSRAFVIGYSGRKTRVRRDRWHARGGARAAGSAARCRTRALERAVSRVARLIGATRSASPL